MNIYFSGIGGVGIGALAQMAVDAGHTVAGSDAVTSLTTDELTQIGIEVEIGAQTADNLRRRHARQPIDWFVYTAALPIDHPELITAKELGLTMSKRDGLLAKLIADSGQQLIAVAGTHGKTTTSGMLVWTLLQLGIPLSYSVGSQMSFGPAGKFNPDAKYFVYECDEFDRNFLKFTPLVSLIVSIDYDHPDTYPTVGEYKAAFRQFIDQSQHTIMWQSDADYIAQPPTDSAWILQPRETRDIQLAGLHNRRNATLVEKLLEYLALSKPQIYSPLLEQFPGTKRRFECIAKNLYSDYGHHPIEIAATLQMAREIADYVVLVYQPHQNIRQHEIRDNYTDEIFKDADEVYWLPTHLSREDPSLEILTPAQLTTNLTTTNLRISEFNDALWSDISQHQAANHLVLCMGAGSIDNQIRHHATA